MICPSVAELKCLLTESLDDGEHLALETHVEQCERCQSTLQQLTSTFDDTALLTKHASNPPARLHPEAEPFFNRLKRIRIRTADKNESLSPLFEIDGYDILGELGRGATGVVYKARYRKLDRLVALKVILAGPHYSAEKRQRFRFEAQAIAKLKHSNIVQIYDVGEHADTPYLSLELIEGGNLAEWLAGKPRTAHEAAKMTAELANAVEFAHAHGVVHRDLKPANVLLCVGADAAKQREVKVTDFGIAKLLPESGVTSNSMTQTGEILGTPAYMAPEQIRSDPNDISPATDVYSIGAILYEMLTGRPPFHGATALDTLMQATRQDPVAVRMLVPTVPRNLETICLKCLEKEPAKRYATAASLAADLERFLKNEPIKARPLSWIGHTSRWVAGHKALATALTGAAILALLVTIAAVIASGYFRSMEQKQSELAEENRSIAKENQVERDHAVEASHREAELRQQAESVSRELQDNLYYNQMQLGSQAAASPSGIGRVQDWLAPWVNQLPDRRNWEWYYLNGLCHRDEATIETASAVFDIAWQPHGPLIASGGYDGVVRIWDTVAQEEVRQFYGHSREVVAVAWSPDAKRLASASYDGTVKIWNADTGQEILGFRNHTAAVNGVAWSPDGTRLASCGSDQTVQIWDAATGQVQFVLQGHKMTVLDVCWSPDGTRLASCGMDCTVRIWDAARGTEKIVLRGHTNYVNRIAWSHNGQLLASASNDRATKIWDVSSGRELSTLSGHAMGVLSVAFSSDDQRLATSGSDQTIRLYNLSDDRETQTLRGHVAQVMAIRWSPDGSSLVSSSMDHSIKFWNPNAADDLPVMYAHEGPVNALAWSLNSREITSVSFDHIVRVWDVATTKERLQIPGQAARLFAVAWSADGTRIASAGEDHTIRIWSAADGRSLLVLPITTDTVQSLAWSPDGRYLACGGDDKLVRIWDVENQTQRPPLVGHSNRILSVAWSPDGGRLASGSVDQSAIVWDFASGNLVATHLGHTSAVAGVTWSPDGKSIATAGADQTVKVWDAADARPAVTLKGHTASVTCISWSPDGTRLASGSDDRTVKLWDAQTGHEALSLECRGSVVRSIAWSPDGLSLATGLEDDAIAVFNALSGYAADLNPRALVALDCQVKDNPDDAKIWLLRARINAQHRDWTQATSDVEHFLALHPEKTWEALGNWTLGPYPATINSNFAPQTSPELCISPENKDIPPTEKSLKRALTSLHLHDHIDLGALYDHAENISAYTLLKIYSTKAQGVRILIGSDDQNRVWLNGALVHERLEVGRSNADSELGTGNLKAGWNDLLVRVVNVSGAHTLDLRVKPDSDGP